MTERERRRVSKFLSLVLRHRPERLGLTLGDGGWVGVDALLAACADRGKSITRAQLEEVVTTNDKQRFAFSDDGARIRANQGHTIGVDLGLSPTAPPARLFHGTYPGALGAIRRDGLRKMKRDHVHLSPDRDTATKVGARRGEPVILVVCAGEMAAAGHVFFVSDNGVWLTDHVPPEFLEFP